MKRLFTLALMCLSLPLAAQTINKDVPAEKLEKIETWPKGALGDIVRLRIVEKIEDRKLDGWAHVRIEGDAYVYVTVPPQLAEWFAKLPRDRRGGTRIAYAVVGQDKTFRKEPNLQLVGREVRTTMRGKEMAW